MTADRGKRYEETKGEAEQSDEVSGVRSPGRGARVCEAGGRQGGGWGRPSECWRAGKVGVAAAGESGRGRMRLRAEGASGRGGGRAGTAAQPSWKALRPCLLQLTGSPPRGPAERVP